MYCMLLLLLVPYFATVSLMFLLRCGCVQVRGPIVVQQYHRHEQRTVDDQRWFSTGDVASIDQHGTMKISDR
jgi:long-subunit acyl-CoA synthetase (AMP-forming)